LSVAGRSSGKAIAALIAYNARACEQALHPTCVCACGGKYHGLKHPLAWVKSATMKAQLEALGAGQEELDLGELSGRASRAGGGTESVEPHPRRPAR